MEDWSDERLARAAADGDAAAFSLLATRCGGMIQQQAWRLRRRWMEAEDLAQEGLLGLYAAVRGFRETAEPSAGYPRASFRTYAAVCVRNRMVSALRRYGFAEREEPLVLPEQTEAARAVDPAQQVVERETVARLWRRLGEVLTPLEYAALRLYLGGHAYGEIAARLGVGTKAVDNALQRVRRKTAAHWREG